MMRTSDFQTWTVFLIAVMVLAGALMGLGRFEPQPQADTQGYRDFPFNDLVAALNHQRTFGYPAILHVLKQLEESNAILPIGQFSFAAFSTGVWMLSLRRIGWNSWLALAASLPILTSTLVVDYSSVITPDLMAQSIAILAMALWLMCVHRRAGWMVYVGLSLFVFLAYQTKPSYLFLIVLVPVGGGIARWWLFQQDGDALLVAVKLALVSVLPFLAWCTMRWFFVGHFGLVAFGGYNAIGIAGQLLHRDLVSRLSAELQPLASDILDRQDRKKNWERKLTYSVIESQYNPTVWEMAVPAASAHFDADSRRMNFALSQLSKEIILQRPLAYGLWLVLALKHAATQSVDLIIRNPSVVVATAFLMFGFAMRWRIRCLPKTQEDTASLGDHFPSTKGDFALEFQTIVWLSLGYAFSSLLLVILVEVPIARYCAPAIVFLPSIIGMSAVAMIRAVIASRFQQIRA